MTAGDIEVARSSVEIDIDALADVEPIPFSPNLALFTSTAFDLVKTKLVKVPGVSSKTWVVTMLGRRIT